MTPTTFFFQNLPCAFCHGQLPWQSHPEHRSTEPGYRMPLSEDDIERIAKRVVALIFGPSSSAEQ